MPIEVPERWTRVLPLGNVCVTTALPAPVQANRYNRTDGVEISSSSRLSDSFKRNESPSWKGQKHYLDWILRTKEYWSLTFKITFSLSFCTDLYASVDSYRMIEILCCTLNLPYGFLFGHSMIRFLVRICLRLNGKLLNQLICENKSPFFHQNMTLFSKITSVFRQT